MRHRKQRIYLILSVLVAFGSLAAVILTKTTPRLGLDLEGGVSVILTARGENVEADVLQETADIIRNRIDALGVAEPEVSTAGAENILIQLPGLEDEEQALELIGTTAQLTFRQVEEIINTANAKKKDIPKVTTETGQEVNKEEVVYPDASDPSILYRLKPAKLTGDVVDKAEAVLDPNTNQWAVSIDMDEEGADVWEDFTSELACLRDQATTPEQQAKAQVAIVLDGQVESAAGMQQPGAAGGSGVECDVGISGGQTQIDTQTEEESKDLALVLRTGSLPITLDQSQVSKISPTLGEESLQQGLIAGALGLALVMIYMILYYRGLGFVVWLGLLVFTAVMYTLLAILGSTAGLSLSLAGVAGVIVSIGVTADSYIVAFERLKDEIRTGKSVRAAVERGMSRAFRTILVADFVTGAAAVILFYLAVGPVRGFALTLGLATIIDVLIAYFFTRSAVVLMADRKGLVEGRFFGLKKALGVTA
jgi:preprotein translocase subunit SecD